MSNDFTRGMITNEILGGNFFGLNPPPAPTTGDKSYFVSPPPAPQQPSSFEIAAKRLNQEANHWSRSFFPMNIEKVKEFAQLYKTEVKLRDSLIRSGLQRSLITGDFPDKIHSSLQVISTYLKNTGDLVSYYEKASTSHCFARGIASNLTGFVYVNARDVLKDCARVSILTDAVEGLMKIK